MKNFKILLFALLVLIIAVQASTKTKTHHKSKHDEKKSTKTHHHHHSVTIKTKSINIEGSKTKKTHHHKTHKTTDTVIKPITTSYIPTPTELPGFPYVPPVKVDKESLNIVKSEEQEKEEKSSSKGTITFVGLALVAVAAGGMSYRSKAKKQLNNTEFFENKNNFVYTFNDNQYREEQSRIIIYEDEPSFSSSNNETSDDTLDDVIEYNVTLPTNRAYKVILPWNARCVDEIQLNCGDLVCIKKCFEDGYSLGRNLSTRFDGIFPTCCLGSIGTSINQANVNKWQSYGMHSMPKRADQPTKKAKRASRGISLLTIPDWSKKLEKLNLESQSNTIF